MKNMEPTDTNNIPKDEPQSKKTLMRVRAAQYERRIAMLEASLRRERLGHHLAKARAYLVKSGISAAR
jgi:hypothetical protein